MTAFPLLRRPGSRYTEGASPAERHTRLEIDAAVSGAGTP